MTLPIPNANPITRTRRHTSSTTLPRPHIPHPTSTSSSYNDFRPPRSPRKKRGEDITQERGRSKDVVLLIGYPYNRTPPNLPETKLTPTSNGENTTLPYPSPLVLPTPIAPPPFKRHQTHPSIASLRLGATSDILLSQQLNEGVDVDAVAVGSPRLGLGFGMGLEFSLRGNGEISRIEEGRERTASPRRNVSQPTIIINNRDRRERRESISNRKASPRETCRLARFESLESLSSAGRVGKGQGKRMVLGQKQGENGSSPRVEAGGGGMKVGAPALHVDTMRGVEPRKGTSAFIFPNQAITRSKKLHAYSASDVGAIKIRRAAPALGITQKTIPSLIRQRTNVSASASPELESVATFTTDRATLSLRKIQDNDLATLQAIWSNPTEGGQAQSGSQLMEGDARASLKRSFSERSDRSGLGLGRALGVGLETLWKGGRALSAGPGGREEGKRQSGNSGYHATPSLDRRGARGVSDSTSSTTSPATTRDGDISKWLYTRWDGLRTPVTPDHPLHFAYLVNRRASASSAKGKSKSGTNKDGSATAPQASPLLKGGKVLRTSDRVAVGEQVTDMNMDDGYFSSHLLWEDRLQGPSAPSAPRRPRSSTNGSFQASITSAPVTSSPLALSSKALPRRPSYRSATTTPVPSKPYDNRPSPLINRSITPTPGPSRSTAISTPHGTGSSASVCDTMSSSFESRAAHAYEVAKGEEGYVSFDKLMGLDGDD